MKPLVIYHANCADGFGAAFAAWLKLADNVDYFPCQYGSNTHKFGWDLLDTEGREVYILDFSFPKDIMESIFKLAKRVVWLDHHKSAFEMWCGEIPEEGSWCEDTNFMQGQHMITLDNNKSGAYLAWEYFHSGTEVPMFIKHIDDRDRWVFAIPGSKELNSAIWSFA